MVLFERGSQRVLHLYITEHYALRNDRRKEMSSNKMRIFCLSLFLVAALAGCAAKNQIFLEPLRIPEQPFQASSTLFFQPLQNNFATQQQGIGTHTIGGKSIQIVSDYSALSDSFNADLLQKMNEKGWQVAAMNGWNMTPEGMAALSAQKGLILSGKIEKLSMSVDTGMTRTNSTYTLDAQVLLVIGDVLESKTTTREIELQEKTIKVTYSQKTMKELFDRFVEEVALKAVEEYAAIVQGQ